jgi:hypothetical protein
MSITTLLKKSSMVAAGAAGVALAMSIEVNPAQAASLSTTFSSNNGQAGNMFDVTTFGNDLNVTGLDLNLDSIVSPLTVKLYTKLGSYVGAETDPSAWTLASTNILNSTAGTDNPTFVDITDFILSANSVTAFYVDAVQTVVNYTNGTAPGQPTFSNADLSIATGAGKGANFGSTFSPRTWNGTVYYDVVAPEAESVPEPASILGLLTVGALGAGSALKRKKQQA